MPSLSAKPGSGTPNSASQSFWRTCTSYQARRQRHAKRTTFGALFLPPSVPIISQLMQARSAGHSPLLFVSRASGECSGSAGSSIRTKGKFAYESKVTQHNDPSDISSSALLPCPASTATPARTDSCEERLQRRPPAGVGHPLFRPS